MKRDFDRTRILHLYAVHSQWMIFGLFVSCVSVSVVSVLGAGSAVRLHMTGFTVDLVCLNM